MGNKFKQFSLFFYSLVDLLLVFYVLMDTVIHMYIAYNTVYQNQQSDLVEISASIIQGSFIRPALHRRLEDSICWQHVMQARG